MSKGIQSSFKRVFIRAAMAIAVIGAALPVEFFPASPRQNLPTTKQVLSGLSGAVNRPTGLAASRASANASQSAPAQRVGKPKLSYADLPLRFEPEQGGASRRAGFVAAGRGYRVSLLPQEARFDFIPPDDDSRQVRRGQVTHSKLQAGISETLGAAGHSLEGSTVSVRVVGGNPDARVLGLDPLSSAIFYYDGNDPHRWRKNVANYGKVKYRDLYPGIDLVYYGNQNQLEYDFEIAPGKDPSQIRLDVAGAQKLRFDEGGSLILAAQEGELLLRKTHPSQLGYPISVSG